MVRRGKAISGVFGNGDRLWVGCDDDVGVQNREGAAELMLLTLYGVYRSNAAPNF